MSSYLDGAWWVRLLLQRGLAAIYLVAFLSAWQQFPALLGERGLLPVPQYLERRSFWEAPSLFHWRYSDRVFVAVAVTGCTLSALALLGLFDRGPAWGVALVWLVLWGLYLSIVNVGQEFYGFGWETLLLEAGFLSVFLGPVTQDPSPIPVLAFRWLLFRTEFGAGTIKLRHDRCWRDFTCLYYHYETQPLPNPLSARFHRLPRWVHRVGVAFSHFVQLVLPFAIFLPQPAASVAAGLIILHQLLLIVSGNYAWLNWLTVVLGFSGLSDGVLRGLIPALQVPSTSARSFAYDLVLYAFALANLLLAYQPAKNLLSRYQRMNTSYNPLHLGSSYGAFGSVTRQRHEVILEGSEDGEEWRAYEFRGKPGDPTRRPRQVAPYHLRLDWLMWFLPLGPGMDRWFLRLVQHLLAGDEQIKQLLAHDPFPDQPPRYLRARLYRYEFADPAERRAHGTWWKRSLLGDFLQPTALRGAPLPLHPGELGRRDPRWRGPSRPPRPSAQERVAHHAEREQRDEAERHEHHQPGRASALSDLHEHDHDDRGLEHRDGERQEGAGHAQRHLR
jgi:hypothetical protein